MWMFYNWLEDQKDTSEVAKNHAYIIGSFINPEAVQKLMGDNTYVSDDKDFDESLEMVKSGFALDLEEDNVIKRSKRTLKV